MKITRKEIILSRGPISASQTLKTALGEIETAIQKVCWPQNSPTFTINPKPKGNGVKPIKNGCMKHLKDNGWSLETRLNLKLDMKPGPIDATKRIGGKVIAVEWETGNISSSHRAINKMALGMLERAISAAVLILPSRDMYRHLTDRVGNFQELSPFFSLWKALNLEEAYLVVYEIEHDRECDSVPLIPKGTDGWANFQ